eukprot:NODE_1175_length_1904_cov_0.854848.p1 type:complete len:147 gc:universal NODE_1175_length_1904_cov_0.854848:1359-919(-)
MSYPNNSARQSEEYYTEMASQGYGESFDRSLHQQQNSNLHGRTYYTRPREFKSFKPIVDYHLERLFLVSPTGRNFNKEDFSMRILRSLDPNMSLNEMNRHRPKVMESVKERLKFVRCKMYQKEIDYFTTLENELNEILEQNMRDDQ